MGFSKEQYDMKELVRVHRGESPDETGDGGEESSVARWR
jgi:hypothetical protein